MGAGSRRSLVFLFLAHGDELEVALILKSDEDADSISCFDLVCDEMGSGVCLVNWQPVPSPVRVLVFRPASLTQSSADEFVDVRAVVAIGFDVEGAEVILKDVVGHAVDIVVVLYLVFLRFATIILIQQRATHHSLRRCSVQISRRCLLAHFGVGVHKIVTLSSWHH